MRVQMPSMIPSFPKKVSCKGRLPSLSPHVGNCVPDGAQKNSLCNMPRSNATRLLCHAAFFERKNRGGLQKPSSSTIYICQTTEKVIRREDILQGTSLPKRGNVWDSLTVSVMTELSSHLHSHMLESAAESNHFVRLVKCVIASYIKIRMHYTTKTVTTKVTGSKIPKQLTKLILFKHQWNIRTNRPAHGFCVATRINKPFGLQFLFFCSCSPLSIPSLCELNSTHTVLIIK